MRRKRILMAGATYHVCARANRGEMILLPEEIKHLFLDTLRRAKKAYRFSVQNFCIMGNHFHLIITPHENESLSRILQWIMSVFAMSYNRRMDLSGHVWGGRFLSRILRSLNAFLESMLYVDCNPVRAGIANHARHWKFGGSYHRLCGNRDVCDAFEPIIQLFLNPECKLLGQA